MKTIVLALLMFVSSTALADSVGVLDCSSDDESVSVSLEKLPETRSLNGQVVVKDEYNDYQVHKGSKSTDETLLYKAKGFLLTIQLKAKKKKGHYPSHISATTEKGEQVESDVLCEIY